MHPKCSSCTRLNLRCLYAKVYQWGEATPQGGITFGRSNQFKKSKLSEKYRSDLEIKRPEIILSLTESAARNNTRWLSLEHDKIHFINTNYEDFQRSDRVNKDKNQVQPQESQAEPISSNGLMQILSSLFLKYNTSYNVTKEGLFDMFITEENLNSNLNWESILTNSTSNSNSNPNANSNSNSNSNIVFHSNPYKNSPIQKYTATPPFQYTNNSSINNSDEIANSSTYMGMVQLLASPSFQQHLHNMMDMEIPKVSLNDPLSINWDIFSSNADLYYYRFNTLQSSEKFLLHYFIDTICPKCVCYPTNPGISHRASVEEPLDELFKVQSSKQMDSNPYLYLIVPLAFKSKILMDTIMATTAHQLFLLGDLQYENVSSNYSERSLTRLPEIIKEKQQCQSLDWDEVLATVLMLCFKEISSNCDYRSSWVLYLNCAKHFLRHYDTNNIFTPLRKFFARYFIIHEVMGETAWIHQKDVDSFAGPDPSTNMNFFSSYTFMPHQIIRVDNQNNHTDFLKYMINESVANPAAFGSHASNDSEHAINGDSIVVDVVFGCCPYLITIIHKVSSLGRCYEDLEQENEQTRSELAALILSKRNEIELKIENLNQKIDVVEIIDDQSEYCIMIIAEIKRLTTFLYLFARVDLERLYYNNGVKDREFIKVFQKMQDIKAKIIEYYKQVPECPMSLLWPLFVLGLVSAIESDDERWFVLDKLIYLQKDRELGSVKTAKEVVLAVWRERDLGLTSFRWKDMIRGRAESLSLA